MFHILRITVVCIGMITVSHAFAASPLPGRDMYLRARERTRQGSELRQVESAVRFLAARSDRERLICVIKKTLPENRGGEFRQMVSTILAEAMGRPVRSKEVLIALTDRSFCDEPIESSIASVEPLKIVRLDTQRAVVSDNPLWNACIRGEGITAALIKFNTDRALHRSGRLRVWRPLSCRDYHRGEIDIWQHPDYFDLTLVLDPHGVLLSALPRGYIALRTEDRS